MSDTIPNFRSPFLIDRTRSGLIVIDVQERLLPSIPSHQLLVWNLVRLIEAARLFSVPVLATEQYPQGLGHTVEPLRSMVGATPEKAMFSCRECAKSFTHWKSQGITQLVLTGIETHVCVQQTAFDLLNLGFEIFLVLDGVGSRFSLDRETAVRRMEDQGVTVTTAEAVMFEWCETSADPQFKALSQIVRRTGPE